MEEQSNKSDSKNVLPITLKIDARTNEQLNDAVSKSLRSRSEYIRGVLRCTLEQGIGQTPSSLVSKIQQDLQTLQNILKNEVKP